MHHYNNLINQTKNKVMERKTKESPAYFLHLTAESPFSLHSSLETTVPSSTLTTRLRHSFLPLTLFLCQVNISSKSVGICLAHIYC